MNQSRFDDLTYVYEAMIDWPRRLANDELLFRRLFQQIDASRVADVACGTGHHAALFHSWGMQVEAADVSAKMIQRAREHFGEPNGLNWAVRSFDEPIPCDTPFDAVTCLGNSLALAGDRTIAKQAVKCMLDATRPGGLVVLHILNVWRLPNGPCQWQKCLRAVLPEGESLITKGVQRVGDRAFVHLIVTPLEAPNEFRNESVPFLALEADDLAEFAQAAGATNLQFFGNQKSKPYDRQSSTDLIVVASRVGTAHQQ